MTNNLTINGVSRELLQRWLDNAEFFNHLDGMSMSSIGAARKEDEKILEELRALLDAQPHEHEWDINTEGTATVCYCGVRSSDAPAVERQDVSELGAMRRLAEDSCNELVGRSLEHTDQVAALQSTIAQLQARVQGLESGRDEPFAWVVVSPEFGILSDLQTTEDDAKDLAHDMDCELPAHHSGGKHEIKALFTAPPAPVAVIPEGWVMVPEEPDGNMRLASNRYKRDTKVATGPGFYRAMLKAAPSFLDATAALNGVLK